MAQKTPLVSPSGAETDSGADPPIHQLPTRVEPELAFLLAEPLPAHPTLAQALDAVAAIAPALEVIDSRIAEWRTAADDYERSGHPDQATRLQAEADTVARILGDPDPHV